MRGAQNVSSKRLTFKAIFPMNGMGESHVFCPRRDWIGLEKESEKKIWSNPLLIGVAASVLTHLLILLFQLALRPLTEMPTENAPIEITEVPKNLPPMPPAPPAPKVKSKEKEIEMAETEEAKNKKEDPNSTILSDRTQTADKQTKAKKIDDFRKQLGKGLFSGLNQKVTAMAPTGKTVPTPTKPKTELGEGEKAAPPEKQTAGIKRDWKTLSIKDLSVGADGMPTGASDDKLNNVQEGDQTILSTREYRYFSYYHRIKELLRQYWKPNVEAKLYKMYERGRQVSSDEMTTKILVLLNASGNIAKISRVGSSGVNELDDAAIEAFQKAAPFPNPPKGIIDPDGFVRIRWDFILKTEAAPRIQFQTAGQTPPPP